MTQRSFASLNFESEKKLARRERYLARSRRRFYGESAYARQKALIGEQGPQAKDLIHQRTRKRGEFDEAQPSRNRYKWWIRARSEHVFAALKLL